MVSDVEFSEKQMKETREQKEGECRLHRAAAPSQLGLGENVALARGHGQARCLETSPLPSSEMLHYFKIISYRVLPSWKPNPKISGLEEKLVNLM